MCLDVKTECFTSEARAAAANLLKSVQRKEQELREKEVD